MSLERAENEVRALADHLFGMAMNGSWKRVLSTFQEDPRLASKATSFPSMISGDTTFHVAVADSNVEVVEKLVKMNRLQEALRTGNNRGNTPLHLAAIVGSVRICRCFVSADSKLITYRNHDGETPLFMAVLHGRKDVFLFLHHYIISQGQEDRANYSLCRRSDGNTILHCAIAAENFGLYAPIFHHLKLFSNFDDLELHFPGINVDKLVPQTQYTYQEGHQLSCDHSANHPGNHTTCIHFSGLLKKAFHSITGLVGVASDHQRQQLDTDLEDHTRIPTGQQEIAKVKDIKEKHMWSIQVLDILLQCASAYKYDSPYGGRLPPPRPKPFRVVDVDDFFPIPLETEARFMEETSSSDSILDNPKNNAKGRGKGRTAEEIILDKGETPILIAAKNGIVEMVEKILKVFPVANQDMNSDEKNLLLLAVENRQLQVYKYILNMKLTRDFLFRKIDKNGNSALHLAGTLGEEGATWLIPAVQMQWEIKWFECVKSSMPEGIFARFNKQGKTPEDVFTETHRMLLKSAGEWLTNTSEACSVVGALVATVAFSTSTTFPGGFTQDNDDMGTPTFKGELAFHVFAISSLAAVSFSVTSVVMFLAILSSRYQEKDFGARLPKKLLLGLTSLFLSITSMLISFCAGHFFLLRDKLKDKPALIALVYALACFPPIFAIVQFPIYFDILLATWKRLPHRTLTVIPTMQN
ncbi:OLC1v1013822C1 [Oldenlandia corymbosa var. corymbosa]|uniref:OLC1v1013822C1 n=1 Tax=Oldenlandia corymbosa var. corymbosa TaxID=529605 RepID=A0AAV1E2N5_OLDCO|nr:OLC1v1013822C1 [Oldenlandia corymbosa var. corymbosa]